MSRVWDGSNKVYVAALAPTEIALPPTRPALELHNFLVSAPPLDSECFLTAPLERIHSDAVHGMVVAKNDGSRLPAHRVRVLVQGGQKSQLLKIQDNEDCRIIYSPEVKCLLGYTTPAPGGGEPAGSAPASGGAELLDQASLNARRHHLRGYAGEMDLLDYKLDTELAVVHISAVTPSVDLDGQASLLCSVDHMQKITEANREKVAAALRAQAGLVLDDADRASTKRPVTEAFKSPMRNSRRISAWPSCT